MTECLRSGWISSAGSFIDRFESDWASYCGRKHGVSVANGTVALQAAVSALELDPGSEIIMPTFTIISCATAALYNGYVPVLVDADPETWCMDVDAVEDESARERERSCRFIFTATRSKWSASRRLRVVTGWR